MSTTTTASKDRLRIRRSADLARYDRATLYRIVDAAYICHLAFHDGDITHCIPTACWRDGDHLYVHGSNGSRMLKVLAGGQEACVTITHLDGLVLARSAFSHTMNYRSAVIYGVFEVVADSAKEAALHVLMDKIALGRQAEVRSGSVKEMAATTVLRIPLVAAACKVRTGGPRDDEADLAHPAWAGELPLLVRRGEPLRHALCGIAAPAYVSAWNSHDHQPGEYKP